jgi:magnesium-transporting ATPase (P-type)
VTAATDPDLRSLLTAAALCNNARLVAPSGERPVWSCLGDQTEAALRVVARKGGLSEDALDREYPRLHELPFDARRKRMSTIHACDADEVAFVKGAPKEVLQLCTHVQIGGQVRPLDDAARADIVAANDDYARNALRVLALARRELPARAGAYTVEGVERQLTFLGLAAMMDPPRPEVAEAVRICREAGIRWVMITGDYGLTAESVARRVGMLPPAGAVAAGATAPPRILTGADVDAMSDADLQAALQDDVVCARMAPDHKLRLVSAFQERGDVVAVIGDGVNDAPALRKADVGIAMGVAGTDVAKEAADVVLTDDNFGAIVSAIEEGRAVYDNLRKAITYIFASNLPELAPFVLTALLNIPLALSVMQILAIDLGTDLLPAMALGVEKPESDVMRRPPVKRAAALVDRRLLSRAMFMIGGVQTGLCYLAFILVYRQAGIFDLALPRFEPALEEAGLLGAVSLTAMTVFHVGVVMAQIGNAFACRTERSQMRRLGLFSNRWLLGAIGISLALIAVLVYFPPVAAVFDHAPIPPVYWLGLATFAPIVFLFDWLRKAILRRRKLTGGAKA